MVNVLQGMSYIQQQGEMGRQRGTQNRLAALASQAYGAPAEDRRGLVQQAIQADPTAGFALGQSLEQDRGQQMGSLSQKARMLVGYAKAGNQQGVQSLYPQLAAEAQQLGLGQGIPQQWDESYLPGIEQLAQMGGAAAGPAGLQEFQSLTTGMSAEDVERARRIKLGLDPRAVTGAARTGMITGADGRPRPYMFNPADQSFSVFDGSQWRPMGQQEMQQVVGMGAEPQSASQGVTQFMGSDGKPVVVGDDIPDHLRQSILSDTPGWDAAAEARLPPRYATPGGQSPTGSLAVGRSPEEQAALTTAAQQSAELGFLPHRQDIETQGAVDRERAVGQVKADQEREAGRPKARLAMEQAKSRVERVDTLVDGIMPRVGYWTAGLMSLSSALPGTPAGDLRRDLGTLQAIAGFDELNAMRASSPTGGALGNVTERELAFLQSVVRNIENSQSPEQLRRNLAAFRNEVQGSWDRIERAYEEDYGQGSQGGRPSQRLRFNPETGRIE